MFIRFSQLLGSISVNSLDSFSWKTPWLKVVLLWKGAVAVLLLVIYINGLQAVDKVPNERKPGKKETLKIMFQS